MSHKIMDEEVESQAQVSRGQLFVVAICLGLSFLCGLLWVVLLLWPQMLTVFQ